MQTQDSLPALKEALAKKQKFVEFLAANGQDTPPETAEVIANLEAQISVIEREEAFNAVRAELTKTLQKHQDRFAITTNFTLPASIEALEKEIAICEAKLALAKNIKSAKVEGDFVIQAQVKNDAEGTGVSVTLAKPGKTKSATSKNESGEGGEGGGRRGKPITIKMLDGTEQHFDSAQQAVESFGIMNKSDSAVRILKREFEVVDLEAGIFAQKPKVVPA